MNRRLLQILVLSLISFLIGCGSSKEDELNHYMAEIKARKPRPIEPVPELESIEKYKYPEDLNRRNPFNTTTTTEFANINAPNTNRQKQPLEAFPLDALKFVGILEQGSVIWALIAAPNNLVTRVKAGDYMGQNFGHVMQISSDKIKLEETIQAGGKWEKRPITINLSAPQ